MSDRQPSARPAGDLVEPPVVSPVAEVLLGAAEYIEKFGWKQRDFGDDGGPRCMLGAVMSQCKNTYTDIMSAAQLHLQRQGKFMSWNDSPGRTKAEVIDALRSAAAKA